jgi:predicted N-acetyltransferase YhbS
MTTDPAQIPNTTVVLPSGAKFSVRAGNVADVPRVTELIHRAFDVWKEKGLKLGPMFQTEAQTVEHLVGKGYVAENSQGEIVGTFSLMEGHVGPVGKGKVLFTGDGDPVEYPRIGDLLGLPSGPLLVFKKAAVQRDAANSGLGSKLYALAERHARNEGYAGTVLETVKEAGWLYDWYMRLGFKPIGSHRYPGRQVDTILMVKPFQGDN